MTDVDVLLVVDKVSAVMVSVATGGANIDDVNSQFQLSIDQLESGLSERQIENPFPYRDLWEWYGYWSSELPTWASRRTFVSGIKSPLVRLIKSRDSYSIVLTGWERVDRTIIEARNNLSRATDAEQFQAVGLHCREALISVAQHVYDPNRHPTIDEVKISSTDFKRMIESFIVIEMAGGPTELARKYVRTSMELSLKLQHARTANFRQAAVCIEATASTINVIATVSGRYDPKS